MIQVEYICGNTGCIHSGGNSIPFYQLKEKIWVLMDTGSLSIRKDLDEYLEKNHIQIRAVLCSHGHFDHTENNRFLQKKYGAELILSVYDTGLLQNGTTLKSLFYSQTQRDNENYCGDMICTADRMIFPNETKIQIDDAVFQIKNLPGHAASHLGFVTPDRVLYLADSLFGDSLLAKNQVFYMLNWTEALKTIEDMADLSYEKYILAHGGVCENLKDFCENNLKTFSNMLDRFYDLFCQMADSRMVGIDEVVNEAAGWYQIKSERYVPVRAFERIIRSMLEYFLENGKIIGNIKNGGVVYSSTRSK